jgi:hypothetical protein
MPLHVHPILRSRELMMEREGLIKPQNSVLYNLFVAQENLGQKPPAVLPVTNGTIIRGNKYNEGK